MEARADRTFSLSFFSKKREIVLVSFWPGPIFGRGLEAARLPDA